MKKILVLTLMAVLLVAAKAPAAWEAPRQVAHEDDVGGQFSSLALGGAPDGRALLAWATRAPRPRILAVDIAADGTIGPVRTLSRAGAVSAPQAALGDGGEAIVAWRAGSPKQRQVQVATRAAGGDFAAPQTITRGPGRAVLSSLGMAADGRALVAWTRRTGRTGWDVEVAVRPAGGAFSAPVRVSRRLAADAHVAVAADGRALVTWTEWSGSGARSRVWHAESTLPAAPSRAGALSGPGAIGSRLAVDADGSAVVAWMRRAERDRYTIEATARPAGGMFGPRQRLEPRGVHASEADVSIAGGHAVVAWSTSSRSRSEVRVARAAPGAAFDAPATLSARGSAAWRPEARAGGGRAVVIWQDTPQQGARNGLVGAAHAPFGSPFPAAVHVSEPNGILQSATQPRLTVAASGVALAAYVNYGLDGESGSGQLAIARLGLQ